MSDENTKNTENENTYDDKNDSGTGPDDTLTGGMPTTGEKPSGDNETEPGDNETEEPKVVLIGNKTGNNDGTKVIPSLSEVNEALEANYNKLVGVTSNTEDGLSASIKSNVINISAINAYIDTLVGKKSGGDRRTDALSATAWTDSVKYASLNLTGEEPAQDLGDGKLVLLKSSDLTRTEKAPDVDITTGMGRGTLTPYKLVENEYLQKTITATVDCIRDEYDALIQRVHEESMAVMAVSRYVMCHPSKSEEDGTLSWDVPSKGWIVGVRTNRNDTNDPFSYKTFDGKTFDAGTSKVALSQESGALKLIGYDKAGSTTPL